MLRPLALTCGLILIGVLSAGCGGGYRAAVRQESKQLLGNGDPKIVRIETVRDLGGNHLVIATLRGHFTLPRPNGPCGEQCRNVPPGRYVWLSFSQPKGMDGFETATSSQIAAIDNAHSARPVFSIFPNSATTAIACAIPRGNSAGTFTGSCSTGLLGSPAHVSAIKFHEAWSFAPSSLGYAHQRKSGGWIVALDRNAHVRSIRRFGDVPPQLWK